MITDINLQTYLLSFMIVITWIILLWHRFRKIKNPIKVLPDPFVVKEVNKIKKAQGWFWIIFSAFGILIVIYAVLQDYYFVFLPLDQFHHPVINITGLIILLISLVWILTMQLSIDKELFKYSRKIDRCSSVQMFIYFERMFLNGMLVLFSGIIVNITNIAGLILFMTGVFFHFYFSPTKPTVFSEN